MIMKWLKTQWTKLAAGVGLIMIGAIVYFGGRFKSNGELNFSAAKREMELNTARGAALQKQLDENHAAQVEVVSDILSEEIALAQKQKANHEATAEDVIARLRAHGLIAP
jgi:hypothetical protein